MTGRQRLMAALRGEPTDRTPMWLLFPYHPTAYYVDVRRHTAYAPVVQAAERWAITLNRRNVTVPLFGPEVKPWAEEGQGSLRRGLEYRGRRLGGHPDGKLLQNEQDLELYCSLPVETDPAVLEAALDAWLPTYLREREEFPAHLGAMMLDLGEPIGPLYHSANLTEYPVWSITHAGLIEDFLDRLMQRQRILYRTCLQRRLAEVYFLVGSELASPPMVSPATFDRWIVPYATELIDMIHQAGAFAIQHYHGQIGQILPRFVAMGADALHTIEAPPVGDCTLDEAFAITGNRITLIGNIQYDEFRSLTPEAMAGRVCEVLAEAAGRRLILSPSAGPFDAHPSPRLIANYLAFLQAGWEAAAG